MSKGVYALFLNVNRNIKVNVGSLGTLHFIKGCYVYAGSAQNNLEKRVARHCTRVKRKFWHVDYLLSNRSVHVTGIFFKVAGKAEECKIADRVALIGTPLIGFGSSDCGCKSHLYRVRNIESARRLLSNMRPYQLKGDVSND
jgi:Uri superfamily endonuclease